MAKVPAPNNLKLRRAILKDVYFDNLEGSARPHKKSETQPGRGDVSAKVSSLWLVMLPVLGLLGYFWVLLPLSPVGEMNLKSQSHRPEIPRAEVGSTEVASAEDLAIPAASTEMVSAEFEAAEAGSVVAMDIPLSKQMVAENETPAMSSDETETPTQVATLLREPDLEQAAEPLEVETPAAETGAEAGGEEVFKLAEAGADSSRNYQGLVGNSKISLAQLFGLEVKTIVIDAGHGGRDPGATGPSGLDEKDVTLDIARRLRDRLNKYPGYRILMTRDGDVKMSTKERVEFANSRQADLYISIHVNSLLQRQMAIIETYYFGAETDEESLQLAAEENKGSEYLMAEFKGMIQRIGDTFKQQESKALAGSIQRSLFRNLKRHNDKLVSHGIKMAPFVVLLGTDMPSVLAEITCISNPEEEKKLAQPSIRETFAQHLENGIVAYLNKDWNSKKLTKGAEQNGKKYTNGKG